MSLRQLILRVHKYFYGHNDKNRYKETNRFLWIVSNVCFRMAEQALMVCMTVHKWIGIMPSPLPCDGKFIVSLTSFPKRIENVWMVVDSIFRQQVKPRKICLYLSNEEFPKGKTSLPQRLLKYEALGLEIYFRELNLMPHNKYFYALQEYGDECIITVDDDIYYHDDTIASLQKIYQLYPNVICANKVCRITKKPNGDLNGYRNWGKVLSESSPSDWNCALGYKGVLYPPHCLDKSDVFNIAKIKQLALKADDLWLKIQEMRVGVKVASGEYLTTGVQIKGSQVTSLMSTNVGCNENDIQWNTICKEYGMKNFMIQQ